MPYDSLIVAAGAGQSYFGHDELALFAPGMKTLDDALELRRRIFGAFEMAETTSDPAERLAWLTIVVVGAGPTGVEIAGQIRELAVRSLRNNFRTFDPATVRVLLVDGGAEPLATFGHNLSARGRRRLSKNSVSSSGWARASLASTWRASTCKRVAAPNVSPRGSKVWAAGVHASPLAAMLAESSGAETDRAGRIATLPDLTLPGHPEVFAVGDMVTVNNLPGVAEVAMQGSLHAANTIVRRLKRQGRPSPTNIVISAASRRSAASAPSAASVGSGSAASRRGSYGCSSTSRSSMASGTAWVPCGGGSGRWSAAPATNGSSASRTRAAT